MRPELRRLGGESEGAPPWIWSGQAEAPFCSATKERTWVDRMMPIPILIRTGFLRGYS